MKEYKKRFRPSIGIDGREITNNGTGIGRYTKNLINNLLKIDEKTKYYLLTNGENIQLGKYNNLTVLSSKPMKKGIWEKHFVPEMVRKHKISLFHNTRSGNTFFQPLDIPYITTVHDIIPLKFQHEFPEKVVERWKNALSPYLEQAEHIISVSNKTAEDLIEWSGINKKKITTIYQGIDNSVKKLPKDEARQKMKNHYGLEHPYLLTIGRNQEYKNIKTLLQACSILPDQIKQEYKLVITGNGAEKYEAIISEYNLEEFVKPLGYVPEELLQSLYCGSEVFIFPSLYEGFGLPPLEAMAFGVPVISSNMETMTEVLGDAAIYFDPRNPNDIAEKITQMLNEPLLCHKMAKKGVEHAEKYSWEKTARKTLNLYQNILE